MGRDKLLLLILINPLSNSHPSFHCPCVWLISLLWVVLQAGKVWEICIDIECEDGGEDDVKGDPKDGDADKGNGKGENKGDGKDGDKDKDKDKGKGKDKDKENTKTNTKKT